MDRKTEIRRYIFRAVVFTMMMAVLPQIVLSQDADDLTSVSLESLLNMQVTSVSRQQEELRSTAAAVYVITQEDIRRSGVTDMAELLRMVPGVNVAQINASNWAVGVRGFNAQYSTKLLVLVDGRTAYDSAFSGVFWHLQNLVLEDIDRIEVIRGPGATMWGANAVNGVISITTKKASETQGGLFMADSGSNRPAEGSLRYGGTIGKNAFYRVFGKQTTRSSSETESGATAGDAWNNTDAGLRLDWSPSKSSSVTLDVAGYRGVVGSDRPMITSIAPLTYKKSGMLGNSGGHVMARWTRELSPSSNLTMQFFYDRRHHSGYHGAKDFSVVDFDLQHNFQLGSRNNVIWGVGHRNSTDHFYNSLGFGLNPASKDVALTSAFVQDEIALVPQKLSLTVGTKFEHSSFTHSNVQPTVRLSWTPTARQSAWVSTSRAVRTPNRVERGMQMNVAAFPTGPSSFGTVDLFGREEARAEELLAYEAGYRYQANRRLWIDVSTFYNVYKNLSVVESGTPFFTMAPQPHLVTPLYFGNAMKGETYGAEVVANYKFTPVLSFRSSYSMLRMALHATNPGAAASEKAEGESPRNQFYLGSFVTLPKSFEISGHTYFVDSLRTGNIPRHTRLDLNIAWKKLENIEFSVVGQNLLGTRTEFITLQEPVNPVGRSVYGKITWRF